MTRIIQMPPPQLTPVVLNPPTKSPRQHARFQNLPILYNPSSFHHPSRLHLLFQRVETDTSQHQGQSREDHGRRVRYLTACNFLHANSCTQPRRRSVGLKCHILARLASVMVSESVINPFDGPGTSPKVSSSCFYCHRSRMTKLGTRLEMVRGRVAVILPNRPTL